MTEPVHKKPFGMSVEFVLQITALIVAVTMSYMAIDFRSKQTEKDIVNVQTEVYQLRSQVREIETNFVRLDERFVNIMTLLTQINERLERTEQRQ